MHTRQNPGYACASVT